MAVGEPDKYGCIVIQAVPGIRLPRHPTKNAITRFHFSVLIIRNCLIPTEYFKPHKIMEVSDFFANKMKKTLMKASEEIFADNLSWLLFVLVILYIQFLQNLLFTGNISNFAYPVPEITKNAQP